MKKLINLTMFDLLKGVAMLGVLFGHSMYFPEDNIGSLWFGKILYSLLMPAFFLVSGYWLKKKFIAVGLKSCVRYLLVPYVSIMLIINIIGFVHRFLTGNISEWVQYFLMPSIFISTDTGSRIGPMWFIIALFWAWGLFYLVVQIRNEKLQLLVAALLGLLGGILMPLKLPFQISQGLIAFFFGFCGYWIKKKKLLEAKIHPLVYVLLAVAWAISVWFGSMNFYAYDIKYGMFSILGSLCGAFILVKIFLYLNLVENPVSDGISWIGRYSMWFLCIHSIEKAVFPWKILFKFVDQQSLAGTCTQFILRLIFIVVACVVVQRVQLWWSARHKDKE